MKPCIRYRPEEVAVLERYLTRAFPMTRREEILPGRGVTSIEKRLNKMRRKAGTLYRVARK